jgi:PAT family beta-lactamase induction signal transducer AmpG
LDVGVVTMTIGLAGTAGGALVGGLLTTAMGLGPALWIFGILQIVSNLGYVAVAEVGIHQPLLYAAMALESVTQGMGTAAFMALLLRLTAKRFSATQYAILSSLFALGRVVAGPVAGYAAAAIGWRDFFLLTMVAGLPGLALLWRFIPLGVREPTFETADGPAGPAAGRANGGRRDQ